MKPSLSRRSTHGIIFLGIVFFGISSGRIPFEGAAEEACSRSAQTLALFDQSLTLGEKKILKGTSFRDKENLSPRLRNLFEGRQKIYGEKLFWERTVQLKHDLMNLLGSEGEVSRHQEAEAEKIAKTAMEGFEDLKKKYGMLKPAFLHNILINTKLKKQGFCWHWTRDLRKRLEPLDLKEFDLVWVTAHEGKIREHNSLVVVPHGQSFEKGILLDGWRRSGTPYWVRVSKDHYPWKPGAYYGN